MTIKMHKERFWGKSRFGNGSSRILSPGETVIVNYIPETSNSFGIGSVEFVQTRELSMKVVSPRQVALFDANTGTTAEEITINGKKTSQLRGNEINQANFTYHPFGFCSDMVGYKSKIYYEPSNDSFETMPLSIEEVGIGADLSTELITEQIDLAPLSRRL